MLYQLDIFETYFHQMVLWWKEFILWPLNILWYYILLFILDLFYSHTFNVIYKLYTVYYLKCKCGVTVFNYLKSLVRGLDIYTTPSLPYPVLRVHTIQWGRSCMLIIAKVWERWGDWMPVFVCTVCRLFSLLLWHQCANTISWFSSNRNLRYSMFPGFQMPY